MKKRITLSIVSLLIIGIAYLTFWPVPVDPVAWNAPVDKGYTGDFAPNNELKAIKRIKLNGHSGPEDVAVGPDGLVYVSTHDGTILRYDPISQSVSTFSTTQGRPLGIEFGPDDNLYVADAFKGLLKINKNGEVETLTNKTSDGSPILYADDLDITAQGVVYFSDASTKFGAEQWAGTLSASLLDLLEHGPNGRILKYDPATKETTVIHKGMSFANGIALTQDERHILVVETGSYAVHKIPVSNPSESEIIADNLPGFPDNINDNPDGTFWIGLASPRSVPVDKLSNKPFLRKVIQRLPAAIRPKPQRYGFIIRMREDGSILETLQDPAGDYALTTGAIDAPDGKIYISSLTEPDLAVLDR